MTGTVRIFSRRGYGFIEEDGTRASRFVHLSQTGWRALRPGERVSFALVDNPRNRHQQMAASVTPLDSYASDEENDVQDTPQG